MEFFLFAGLIALDIVLFVVLAVRYKYVESEKTNDESKPKALSPTSTVGNDNKAFTSETQI